MRGEVVGQAWLDQGACHGRYRGPTRFSAWRSLTNRYRMTRCSSCSSTKPKHHCGEERQVIQALGDGAYDRNEIFNILERRGITSGIKTQDRCRDPLDRVTLSG